MSLSEDFTGLQSSYPRAGERASGVNFLGMVMLDEAGLPKKHIPVNSAGFDIFMFRLS